MGGTDNGTMQLDWRGPRSLAWHVTFRGEVLYDADKKINKMTPEAWAYARSMEGRVMLEAFEK